jgi:hypothetical protein
MNSTNRTEIIVFSSIWLGWWLFINFSGMINTIGVFHSDDGSLFIPSLYGAFFNALLFFGNAHYLISRFLLDKQVSRYLIIFIAGFAIAIVIDSTLDYFYHQYYYDSQADFVEIIIGNSIIDFFFIVIPSFLYRFGKDWFHPKDNSPITTPSTNNPDIISVKSGKTVYQIPLDQLTHLESDGNYVKYHYNGKYILSRDSLSNLEDSLTKSNFIRCHKSFIAARMHVTKITYDALFLDKIEIPIGRAYREQVKDFFNR